MIEHVWTVICSRVVIDKDSNNASIQNVLEQINLSSPPGKKQVLNMPWEAISFFVRTQPDEPVKGKCRFRLIGPSGKEYFVLEDEVDLTNYERVRKIIRFGNLNIEELGYQHFQVELLEEDSNWNRVANVPLNILCDEQDVKDDQAELESASNT